MVRKGSSNTELKRILRDSLCHRKDERAIPFVVEVTTVRLKVEQNQLLGVVGLFGCGLIGLEGA